MVWMETYFACSLKTAGFESYAFAGYTFVNHFYTSIVLKISTNTVIKIVETVAKVNHKFIYSLNFLALGDIKVMEAFPTRFFPHIKSSNFKK